MMFQEITSVEITPTLPDFSGETKIRSFPRLTPKPILEIRTENASSMYQPPEFETETAFALEIYRGSEQREVLIKISNMINKIMEEEKALFEGIDTSKLLRSISKIISETTIEWDKIPDEVLFERLRRIIAIEAMSGLLKNLTPEEEKTFESAVKRRPLFK